MNYFSLIGFVVSAALFMFATYLVALRREHDRRMRRVFDEYARLKEIF